MQGYAKIRPAARADIPAIWKLMQGKAEFDGGIELLQCSPDQLEQALFEPPPQVSMLVAEREHDLIGLASYFSTFSTFLASTCVWLDDLFVSSDHRNRGVGRQLMQSLSVEAVKLGAARMEWTVAEPNEAGQRFYGRCGATIRNHSLCVRLARDDIKRLANDTN